ncbi:MAG TPA: hypothetical protein VLX08_01020 [Steroidobacteraceae bacterium]|nr:hypothetical protein [Steroidobacteraceae bacterium]
MKRSIVAFVVALFAWVLIVSLLDRGLRLTLNGYAAAEPAMHFTVAMMAARLVIAAVTSLLAGAVAGWIAPRSTGTPAVLGAVLLVVFIPEHVRLWPLFPVWYHLTFLLTLVPLVVLGARIAQLLQRSPVAAVR